MARGMAATSLLLLLTFLIVTTSAAAAAETARAPAVTVGGRRNIKDVGSNKEVQSLGRFAVAEHNRRLRHGAGGGTNDPVPVLLAFTAVASAQEQVVSGKAYYLKVIARDRAGGGDRPFDAVVVVRAWLGSKELVSFTPSPK